MKHEREFFDPAALPWRPAAGYPSGVWEQVIAGGEDEGVTTRFLRFEPGAGNDAVVTHDFWEEIYIVSGSCVVGGATFHVAWLRCGRPACRTGPSALRAAA
jgi:hypothetical protein